MKYILSILLLLITFQVKAQTISQMSMNVACGLSKQIIINLESIYKEIIHSMGPTQGRNLVLFTNRDDPYNWTMVLIIPTDPKIACIVASGYNWEQNLDSGI